MMYADYTYYTGTYGGKLVPEPDWARVEQGAEAYLRGVTGGRAGPQEDLILRAACAVAEELWRQEQGGALKSQTVGSWKKTYADGENVTPAGRLYAAAALWLGSTGLLCRWC